MNTEQIIEDLKRGNERFLSGASSKSCETSISKLKKFAAEGQLPKAIVLCCSDSRAPAEIVFDQDIGDLFVIRVAGNIVAPSLIGSVEFAAARFGTSLVLVMGHSQCGAIKATLEHIEDPQTIDSENLHDIVSRIKPHVFQIARRNDLSFQEKCELATEANLVASIDQLSHSSRLIESLVRDGRLAIQGAILDIATGRVKFLEDL